MELFPVSFKLHGKRYERCKVIADRDGSTIWQWDRKQNTAVSVYETEAQPVRHESKRSTWVVGEVSVLKGCTPCGGGGKLAKWRPSATTVDRVQAG